VGQWRLQSKTIQLKLLLLETNTNTFIEIVIRLHLENFNTWVLVVYRMAGFMS
jgi:hypothetical protein